MSLTKTGRSAEHANGIRKAARTLHPGYFALVMATGIVSIAMHQHHLHLLSAGLFWLACIAYVVLVVLTATRVITFGTEFAADFGDPRRAFSMFTFVAGTDVLGARFAVDTHYWVAFALLMVGCPAWLILGYVVPWTAITRTTLRPVLQHANGTWFIWVVASQSVAVLAAGLEPVLETGRRELALLAVFSWSVGVFLYATVGIFVGARVLLFPLHPEDLTPPYWVSMGATAITVVAGARIVEMAHAPMVDATRGLIAGTSVVFWTFGTWLIPPLIAASIWKHAMHRIPLRYEAPLWSVIFPLGMYAVGGQYLGSADQLPIVEYIGADEAWVALVAWALTFVAMLRHLVVRVGTRAHGRRRS
ncbi:tellurite resistance/C4-dicarboxylate transporter family protein [Mycobacterium sp. pUA109]|uniref:tellurite resistance/C4-dicarboxylate transporter family protein n=1 Tax=Mycobacterium sp. pUA109 TaxID=3238982 RepID=UPI00351AFA9C